MHVDARTPAFARRVGTVALVGVTVAAATGLARGLPDPELMANLDNSCLQFSEDGGQIWGDVSVVQLDSSFTPVPGGEYLQADFLARNNCATPASLQVYAGMWDVAAGASATWRTDLAGAAGSPVTLTGPSTQADWGVLIGETSAPRGQEIPVRLYLGIPAGETMQNYSVNPGWAFSLEATAPTEAPDAPTDLEVQPGSPTTDDPVTVTGNAEPGSQVNVLVDGEVVCTTTATDEGTFSCDLGELPEGTHVITATATNSVGTSDPSAPVSVTVRDPDSGGGTPWWGSLGDLFGFGSLAGIIGLVFGSLGSLGSLFDGGSLGSLGSSGGSGSLGSGSLGSSDDDETTPPAPGSGGSNAGSSWGSNAGSGTGSGSTSNATGHSTGGANGAPAGGGQAAGRGQGTGGNQGAGQSGTGGSGASAGGDGNGTAQGQAAGGGSGGSGGSQGSGGSEAGYLSDQTLGLGAHAPGGGTAPAETGYAGGTTPRQTGAVGTGSLGGTGSVSLGSVEGLILLGGPTIRGVPG